MTAAVVLPSWPPVGDQPLPDVGSVFTWREPGRGGKTVHATARVVAVLADEPLRPGLVVSVVTRRVDGARTLPLARIEVRRWFPADHSVGEKWTPTTVFLLFAPAELRALSGLVDELEREAST